MRNSLEVVVLRAFKLKCSSHPDHGTSVGDSHDRIRLGIKSL